MKNYKKQLLLTVSFLAALHLNAQQSFREIINESINDYLVPTVLLGLLLGVIIGLFRNWDDVNNPQRRKEGLVATGVVVLYAALIVGALSGLAALFGGLNISI